MFRYSMGIHNHNDHHRIHALHFIFIFVFPFSTVNNIITSDKIVTLDKINTKIIQYLHFDEFSGGVIKHLQDI